MYYPRVIHSIFLIHAQFYWASLGRKRWQFIYDLMLLCSSTLLLCTSNKYCKATLYWRLSSILCGSYKDQSTTFFKNLKKIYRLSMRTLSSFCSRQGLLPASVPLLWNSYSPISLLSCPGFFFSLWWFWGFCLFGDFFFLLCFWNTAAVAAMDRKEAALYKLLCMWFITVLQMLDLFFPSI